MKNKVQLGIKRIILSFIAQLYSLFVTFSWRNPEGSCPRVTSMWCVVLSRAERQADYFVGSHCCDALVCSFHYRNGVYSEHRRRVKEPVPSQRIYIELVEMKDRGHRRGGRLGTDPTVRFTFFVMRSGVAEPVPVDP